MVWHIKKTSMFGSGVGTVYYKGDNRWTETFAIVKLILLKQKQKQRLYLGKKPGWDVTAVNEDNDFLFSLILLTCDVCSSTMKLGICAVDIPC